ncbi:MAG: hypothetical protein EBT36_10330, partial [Betaproteobacteria bacterium]|nr:hypothetical protein [Betaproteobacteria bacterium]
MSGEAGLPSGKLVRDRIPDIIKRSGGSPNVRTLSHTEFRTALHAKLNEESNELLEAPAESALEELADVYEVFLALVAERQFDLHEVVLKADQKRAERGGF